MGPSPDRVGGIATYLRSHCGDLRSALPGASWEFFATDKGTEQGRSLWTRLAAGARVASSLMARLSRAPPRLVHLHCGGDRTGWALREAHLHLEFAQRSGAKTILHLHAPDLGGYARRAPGDASLLRQLLSLPDRIVTVADALGAEATRHGAPADRVRVVPYPMPVPPIRLRPARHGTVKEPLRLLMVGVIDTRKAPDVLIGAMERLRAARGPIVEARVLGPLRCAPAVKERWEREGAAAGVRFLGPVEADGVRRELDGADIFVHPARADALPLAVLEAMAEARPVVASAVGGLPALLGEGAGISVPPEDPAALAEALLWLVDDPEHRLDVAAAGYHRVRRRHDPALARTQIFSLYRELMGVACDERLGRALLT